MDPALPLDCPQCQLASGKSWLGGPLPESELRQVYERIIDVMRNIQKNEIAPKVEAEEGRTDFDVEVND